MVVTHGTHTMKPKHSSSLTPAQPFLGLSLVQASVVPTQRHHSRRSLPLGVLAHWKDG